MSSIVKSENFTGRAKEQTEEFLAEVAYPVIEKNREFLGADVVVNV